MVCSNWSLSNISSSIYREVFVATKRLPVIGHALEILQSWEVCGFSYCKKFFHANEIQLSEQAKEKFDVIKKQMGIDKNIILFKGDSTGVVDGVYSRLKTVYMEISFFFPIERALTSKNPATIYDFTLKHELAHIKYSHGWVCDLVHLITNISLACLSKAFFIQIPFVAAYLLAWPIANLIAGIFVQYEIERRADKIAISYCSKEELDYAICSMRMKMDIIERRRKNVLRYLWENKNGEPRIKILFLSYTLWHDSYEYRISAMEKRIKELSYN